MSKLKDIVTSIRVGAPVKDLGRADEVVIRYKDKFITILEDPETGEIKSLGWSDTPTMFHVPIREWWSAKPPKSTP